MRKMTVSGMMYTERKRRQYKMFLIIDGSSMLSSSYYGNLPKQILFAKTEEERAKHYDKIMHAPDGTYTNGIFTMLRTCFENY